MNGQGRHPRTWSPLFAVTMISYGLNAEARPGDVDQPIHATRFPFVIGASTVGRDATFDSYACASATSEGGPEVVFSFEVARRSRVTVTVRGDSGDVDIDAHLLSSLAHASGVVSDCIDRGNTDAGADLDPGTYFAVVDSYRDATRAGPFTLRIDVAPFDDWYEREVGVGVKLRTKIYPDLFGSAQNGSVIDVDLGAPQLEIKPIEANGCETVSSIGQRSGALAAINGGFFGTGCASVSLLKIDGRLIATNATSRTAFGIDAQGTPMFEKIDAGADWPAARQALGGVPRMVVGGAVSVADEGAASSFITGANPRTGVATTSNGHVILGTVDGRTSAGGGMSVAEFGQWMVWLGAQDALNFDGGGSTTLWVQSEPYDGVVNYPSDNGVADHLGQRPVANALGIFAEPIDRAPELLFSTEVATTCPGEAWTAELVAHDPEGEIVRFEVDTSALAGTAVLEDRGDGTAHLVVAPASGDVATGFASVLVVGSDGTKEGTWELQIPTLGCGGPTSDAGVDADAADTDVPIEDAARDAGFDDSGSQPDASPIRDAAVPDARAPSVAPEEGCGCRETQRSKLDFGIICVLGALMRRRKK